MKLSVVDRWLIGYSSALSLAALVFASDQRPYFNSHLFHGAAILVACGVASFIPARGRFLPFVRHGYPVVLFGLFYRETGPYVFLFFDHWFDPALVAYESSLFGFNVPEFVAGIRSVWLLELFMFGYVLYYALPPLACAVAVVTNRQETFRRMMEALCPAFFVSFAMFALFPLEGPRHALAATLPPIEGGPFFALVMAIQNKGSIHGGCMPSSHTAVAWVLTYYVHKMSVHWGRALVVVATLLSVGCFWGRFHYVTDVVVGAVLFLASVVWVEWRWGPEARRAGDLSQLEQEEGAPCIP